MLDSEPSPDRNPIGLWLGGGFNHRNNAGPNDIVIYFVRSTVPVYGGCATHPQGRPGAVVASDADRWTLAHEIGHVLGLSHPDTQSDPLPERLMTGEGISPTSPPPDVVAAEVATMKSSLLTVGA